MKKVIIFENRFNLTNKLYQNTFYSAIIEYDCMLEAYDVH